MTLMKLIILVAISYCCCSVISCASSDNFDAEAGSSTSGNADSQSAGSLQAEMKKLAKLLFMSQDEFDVEKPRLLETNEVKPLINQFADLQDRYVAGQAGSELSIAEQTNENQQDQQQNRWANPTSRFMLKALREFILLAEEENEQKIVRNCESLVIMKNVKGTSSLISQRFPVLSKFAEENYAKTIQKCVDLVKSRFELFLSLLGDKQIFDGRDFAEMIGSSINTLKLFGAEEDTEMRQHGFAEAAARYVENFGGPAMRKRDENTDEAEFRRQFLDRARSMMNSVCENVREYVKDIFSDSISVLLQIASDKLQSLNNFDEYNDWLSVAAVCQFWPRKLSPETIYNAHVSFHMDLENLKDLKSLRDALFSVSASPINDADEIESRLKLLRNELVSRGGRNNSMFILSVEELNTLLDIKNRKYETKSQHSEDDENEMEDDDESEHDAGLMQQIEALIEYYQTLGANNIVFYLTSLINEQTGDSLAELETILRAGIQELANYPQINENLRELRRFVQGSNNIMAEITERELFAGLTDYFLNNLQNLQQISDIKDYESRKDLVSRWFNQFMNENCVKYKHSFDGILPVHKKVRSDTALKRLDDELTVTLFNAVLCTSMDINVLNHIDELTRLISGRVDGGGPSDKVD